MTEHTPFDPSELNLRPTQKSKVYRVPATGSPEHPARSEAVYDLDAEPAFEPEARPDDADPGVTHTPLGPAAGRVSSHASEPTAFTPVAPSPFEAEAPAPAAARAAQSSFNPIAGFGSKLGQPRPESVTEQGDGFDLVTEPNEATGFEPAIGHEEGTATAVATTPAIESTVATLIETSPHEAPSRGVPAAAEPPPLSLRDVREFVDPSGLPVDELDKLEGIRCHPPQRAVSKYVLVLDEFENTPELLDTLLREHAMSVAGVNVQPIHAVKKNGFIRACEAAWVLGPINASRHGLHRLMQRARSKVYEGWFKRTKHPIRPATAAKRYGVVVDEHADVNTPEFRKMLTERGVEMLICIGANQVFAEPLRLSVPFGAINVHGSLLPHYRGKSPTLHALADGQRTGGVSVHYATKNLNDGPVLAERAYTVHTHDTVADVNRRSREVAGDALLQAVRKIEFGTLTMAPNTETAARVCDKPRRRDVRLIRKSGRKLG